VKVFLQPLDDGTAKELANAKRILESELAPHRNVLTLHASSDRAPATPPDGSQLPPLTLPCIVCELCAVVVDGQFRRAFSLHGVVNMKPFDERFARHFFSEILHGLRYLHSMSICHRDLKTENVMIDGHGILKVGDFGAAKHTLLYADGGDGGQLYQTNTFQRVGTLGFFSPEFCALRRSNAAGHADASYGARAVDIFAMGMILLYLVGVDEFIVPSFREEPNPAANRRALLPFANEDFRLLEDAPLDFYGRLDEAAPRFESFWAHPNHQVLSRRLSANCKDLINRCMVRFVRCMLNGTRRC
jgi:serine/threonine protein kinase